MKRRSPTISLGDLARALGELNVRDPATVKLVAGMLGFEIGTGPVEERASAPRPSEDVQDDAGGARESWADDEEEAEEERADEPQPERRAVPIEVNFSAGGKQKWIPEVEPFPPQPEDVNLALPPLDPLFTPQLTRGIISASLATPAEDGPLDVERVAEMLANREVVRRLPTIPSKTMRRGAHLLLDKSQAMMPYVRDQGWLTREIRRVVGESHVEVFRFAGSPLRGAGVGARPWPLYSPPQPRTPVVLLTDLGICRPAGRGDWAVEGEWAEFGETVRHAGCPLIAFVPYGPARWPRALARRMTIVQWDSNTTAASISKILRLSAEVART